MTLAAGKHDVTEGIRNELMIESGELKLALDVLDLCFHYPLGVFWRDCDRCRAHHRADEVDRALAFLWREHAQVAS